MRRAGRGGRFGWQTEDAGPAELTGGYAFFTCRGRKVAGVGRFSMVTDPQRAQLGVIAVATP